MYDVQLYLDPNPEIYPNLDPDPNPGPSHYTYFTTSYFSSNLSQKSACRTLIRRRKIRRIRNLSSDPNLARLRMFGDSPA